MPPWDERIKTLATPGRIRLLSPPPDSILLSFLWSTDMTLTEWTEKIEQCQLDHSVNSLTSDLMSSDYPERLTAIFAENQRKRWLARIVLHRWTHHVWRRRTQCNIDMIDMQPITDDNAIFLTDTKHHTIFRFHKQDVFKNLLTNICMSDEMLPTPRYPTNPWTNSTLTMAQTMGLCQQLATHYGRAGRCPPVLFAAFWAARFDLNRFLQENSGLLAQHAVTSFFKDLHNENQLVVFDTIVALLTYAGLNYSPIAIRRWLSQTPQTPLHREWLDIARDYTLYINLHVQVRTHWTSETQIYVDVRRLYSRTVLPEVTSQRTQLLRSNDIPNAIPPPPPMFGLIGLPMLLQDPSSNIISENTAIQLIYNVLNHLQ